MRMGSTSMAPTLAEGEVLDVDLTAYTGYSPARWHIVTFQSPEGAGFLNYRVVGLPGDVVSYDAKKVLRINGNAVTLTRIDLNTRTEFGEEVLVESFDGERHLIQVRDEAPPLMLEAVAAFPGRENCEYARGGFSCLVPPNNYFVMGDNRDSSRDSRYRGFIPLEKIVGRVENSPVLPSHR
jgi:signal peptidase I